MSQKPVFSSAVWICPAEWVDVRPKNILHKEHMPFEMPPRELPDQLHYVFRKTFSCDRVPESCTLHITADDYYKLYLNGRYICQGPAQGYAFAYYWNEVEITPYLQPGENTLAAEVYYHGRICRSYQSGDDRIGLIAEAVADGFCLPPTAAGNADGCAPIPAIARWAMIRSFWRTMIAACGLCPTERRL